MSDAAEGFPFRFRCRRSGNCCARPEGRVRVDASDVRRIAQHLGLSERGFRSRFVAASGGHLVDAPGGRCVFLEEGRTARCSIHPVRPERCRSWPFWNELLENEAELRDAVRLCPGIQPLHPSSRGSDE